MIYFQGKSYELVKEYKNGWNLESFRSRHNEVLDRYDYIVGDWGYNQLRLKGFYKEDNPRVTKETSIANLQDYIDEYCNFGCAHFVIQKTASNVEAPEGYEEDWIEAIDAAEADNASDVTDVSPVQNIRPVSVNRHSDRTGRGDRIEQGDPKKHRYRGPNRK